MGDKIHARQKKHEAAKVRWMSFGRWLMSTLENVHRKKSKKILISVTFKYVCVAENVELLFFCYFFFAHSP